MTPTMEAVTWGSPLYTFRWLLDRGSCEERGGGAPGESSPGPMVPEQLLWATGKSPLSPFSRMQQRAPAPSTEKRAASHSPALGSPRPGRGQEEPKVSGSFCTSPREGLNQPWSFCKVPRVWNSTGQEQGLPGLTYHRARQDSHCIDRSH